MYKLIISFFLILFSLTASSQDFDYTVSTDSVSWQELNSQTILNTGNAAWSFAYRIPIGFSFNYLGQNFDSLTIETNGYLVFDRNRSYAFTAFNDFTDRVDSLGNHAVIGYELSGTSGNHILKIQFLHAGTSISDSRSQSWQIWLRENGAVEMRVGPGDFAADSTQHARIGLVNQNMDTAVRGFFIGGNPVNPSSQPVNDTYPENINLNSIPPQGYRYTFSPSAN